MKFILLDNTDVYQAYTLLAKYPKAKYVELSDGFRVTDRVAKIASLITGNVILVIDLNNTITKQLCLGQGYQKNINNISFYRQILRDLQKLEDKNTSILLFEPLHPHFSKYFPSISTYSTSFPLEKLFAEMEVQEIKVYSENNIPEAVSYLSSKVGNNYIFNVVGSLSGITTVSLQDPSDDIIFSRVDIRCKKLTEESYRISRELSCFNDVRVFSDMTEEKY